ncbi:hypothetical protein BBK82_26655 [Lentzea guizhouensis]|uniref:Toxin n=1 Tax=Lentzea guizhouensis TaxID=1586287 RepID=A0A1B2HN54_9PSEU|nr:hypothetical protein BBK82_26655 [Lentzea guizhouensis]
MEIRSSARKHGVSDADMRHAVEYAVHEGEIDDDAPWRVLYLGPDTAGNLLEVITVEDDDGDEVVIHAMKMRPKYFPLLARGR